MRELRPVRRGAGPDPGHDAAGHPARPGIGPGEIVGWGLLDADACRELAADGAWRRWLTDPVSGQLLDVGAREYVPSAALARFIRGRDRCCRWPGCNLPAVRCDLDHRTPFDHDAAAAGRPQVGPTVRENLDPLCRRHHRIKTVTAWASTRDADGGPSAWTSPCGRVYVEPGDPDPAGDLRLDLLQHVERATRAETPQTRLPAATARVPAAAARSEHVPDYPDEPPS
jgi:hypothetical protein